MKLYKALKQINIFVLTHVQYGTFYILIASILWNGNQYELCNVNNIPLKKGIMMSFSFNPWLEYYFKII